MGSGVYVIQPIQPIIVTVMAIKEDARVQLLKGEGITLPSIFT